MRRHADWQEALSCFLLVNSGRSFEWGRWDCCLWVADAIEVMTEVDIAAEFRGEYRNYREALMSMRRHFGDWRIEVAVEKVAAAHSMGAVPVAMARRGDLVLIGNGRRFVTGIVDLNGRQLIALADRLIRIPISLARRAWRV